MAGYTAGALDGETNSGGNDIFLTKYDASGARQWTRLSGTAGGDESGWAAVAVYGSDSIYVTGYTSGALDGETNAGGSDIFLMKYNSSGTKQWTRLLGTASSDVGWSVAVDGSGNVYVAGTTEGDLDGQTNSGGTYDTFLTKYNSSGTKQWTRLLGNGTELLTPTPWPSTAAATSSSQATPGGPSTVRAMPACWTSTLPSTTPRGLASG